MDWRRISQLREPYNDAWNYRNRNDKDFFQKLFVTTEELERILLPSTYFLMGEKGAGKTAYAVYLENNERKEHKCKVTTMTEAQYNRFIALKRQGKLTYSDYSNIWRSILLFLVGRLVVEKSKSPLHTLTRKFSKVETEIARWSKNALNPEVENAFEAITSEMISAKVKHEKVGEAGAEQKSQNTEKSVVLRHHLLDTENSLKEAISALKLTNNHILFVDGIDFRPETVPHIEYIECIKGLGEAIWQLNTEFFNSIRDSKGRIKIVLLVRPDVFHTLNLYNSNSRLQDNCVFLDWSTTEREYEISNLYKVCGKYFSSQQTFKVAPAVAWEQYYDTENSKGRTFKHLLKNSFHKPRDILTFVKITKKHSPKIGTADGTQFPLNISEAPAVTREFSDYLLGEVKNYSAFYMSHDDFAKYLKFFQYLNGRRRFTMVEFAAAFKQFKAWAEGETFSATSYLRDPESLLQLFYDVNVIGYSENVEGGGETFFHWSYRERSVNNIAPKVNTNGLLILNPGIAKALDIGKATIKRNLGNATPRPLHEAHRKNKGRKKSKKSQSNPSPLSSNSSNKPASNTVSRRGRGGNKVG